MSPHSNFLSLDFFHPIFGQKFVLFIRKGLIPNRDLQPQPILKWSDMTLQKERGSVVLCMIAPTPNHLVLKCGTMFLQIPVYQANV